MPLDLITVRWPRPSPTTGAGPTCFVLAPGLGPQCCTAVIIEPLQSLPYVEITYALVLAARCRHGMSEAHHRGADAPGGDALQPPDPHADAYQIAAASATGAVVPVRGVESHTHGRRAYQSPQERVGPVVRPGEDVEQFGDPAAAMMEDPTRRRPRRAGGCDDSPAGRSARRAR